MNEERSLEDIKNDIKIIVSNRLSMYQSKLLFMGLIYEIILRKDLFPQNSNLKTFIDKVIIKYLDINEPFRDYLYDSRTLLGSRIQRIILKEVEYSKIIQMVKEIYEILPGDEVKNYKNKKSIDINKEVVNWMNFIGENK